MKSCKISVIIPCYNAEKWIEECVLSVMNQKYEDVELIVVDNESTDASVKILKDLQSSGLDFTLSSAPNIYPHCWDEAREVGFQLATGEYLLTICADDYIHPDFIKNYITVVNYFKEKPLALQSPIKGVKSDNVVPYAPPIQFHNYDNLDQFKQLCLSKCPVNTPSVMFHRSLYERGLLKARPDLYGGAADYDLYCRLADEGVFIYPIPSWAGYYYRWHSNQATWGVLKSGINYDERIQKYWRERW
tara:strand:+ start:6239 stop:6976 length:738 start_codon:yes stop_codon:yes gene_type:complete